MAGRAGRRGIDPQGYVIIPYSPWVTFREALAIATGPLRPVESAFTVRYNTILNLWDPPQGDRVLGVMRHSLLQFQQSRRLRELEDGVAEWDTALDKVPRGCLIGLPAGEDLLSEYEALGRTVETGRDRARKLRNSRARIEARRTDLPWTRPDRETLRRTLRVFPAGGVLHLENQGWAVYVGPQPGSAGLFWLGERVLVVPYYTSIDYIPPQRPVVTLPAELTDLAASVAGPTASIPSEGMPVSHEARAWMGEQLAGIDLPDLDQWIISHRTQQGAEIDAQLAAFDQQLAEADDYVTRLGAEERAHPCHTCPVRKQHRSYRRERAHIMAGRQEAVDFLEERRTYEDTRLQTLLDGLIAVLRRFYYLNAEGETTAKAARLMDVFDTNALLICEVVEAGYLEDLPPSDVAEVFSWFAYDRDIEFRNRNLLPGSLVNLRRRLDELQREIFQAERKHDLWITTGYNGYFYGVVRAWCRGASMSDLLSKVELSEGDIVMSMTKTLDLMRQVREMLLHHEPSNPLYATLREAERLLRRGVVEMVNSIGFIQSEPSTGTPGEPSTPAAAAPPKPVATGFADVDRMLGLLADPDAPPPTVPPPDRELQRPERPSRFPRSAPPRDDRARERPARPPAFTNRDRPAERDRPTHRPTGGPRKHGPSRDSRPGHKGKRG
jgi:ATP-dependent RNA helicase HelY